MGPLPPLEHEPRPRPALAWAVRMAIILAVGGAGAWLVFELDRARKAQECLESGQRNCAVIQTR
jgi:hypothetical protein